MRISTRTNGLRRSERLSLAFCAAVAAIFGVLAFIGALSQTIAALFNTEIQATLSTVATVPADAANGSAALVTGTFATADVTLTGVSVAARVLLGSGILATGLMYATLAAAVVFLCVSLWRGRPFSRLATWLLATASITLLAGGVLGQGLSVAGQFMIASELNPDPIGSVFPFAGTGTLFPLVAGIGLGVIAAAFEFGQRLQRDTDGLV
ncbi:hypothetical protein [Glaciibacter psychrotolerans]|uniref:DUF2975 domain-containing protein n=1 Tax=Glaciibacter psychrotolerans TaxID=670054 RepID=A0A7Z0EGG6_9MICO|nr:hypothetical protein [Leifsonia psychrotolerans]NYJ21206.1 hypothetical protein [Leifsonia psychrotolerans]